MSAADTAVAITEGRTVPADIAHLPLVFAPGLDATCAEGLSCYTCVMVAPFVFATQTATLRTHPGVVKPPRVGSRPPDRRLGHSDRCPFPLQLRLACQQRSCDRFTPAGAHV